MPNYVPIVVQNKVLVKSLRILNLQYLRLIQSIVQNAIQN